MGGGTKRKKHPGGKDGKQEKEFKKQIEFKISKKKITK